MTFLYDALYAVVLLRSKKEVKLLTQRVAKWICMWKWPVPMGGFIFTMLSCSPVYQICFLNDSLLANSSGKYSKMTFFEGEGAK